MVRTLKLIDAFDKLVLCHRVFKGLKVVLATNYHMSLRPPDVLDYQVLSRGGYQDESM